MRSISIKLVALVMLISLSACSGKRTKTIPNPFLSEYTTSFQVPPFAEITLEHIESAMEIGMAQQLTEVDSIVNNPKEPTFENTIAALDYSGRLLDNVVYVYYNYNNANNSPELEVIAQRLEPRISAHWDNISLNPELFERVKKVYEQKDELKLNSEQIRLLTEKYKEFIRNGAELPEEEKERFREINQRLAELSLRFGQNVLGEVNNFQLIIDNEEDLSGLPQSLITAASEAAAAKGHEGKWMFTLHNSSVMPFLANAENRELRKVMQQAYVNRGNNDNDFNNNSIIGEMLQLRLERANMLGYENHAEFTLEETMAGTTENVMGFLENLWDYALPIAKKEAAVLQGIIDERGGDYKLEAWDWRYYAERVRNEKYELDEEEIRRYFELDTVREGIFMTAERLWGLKFVKRDDIPVYHPDVTAWEALEADGSHRGILYMDMHPRENKRGGAWMSTYRSQYRTPEGEFIYPVVTIVCNFTPPSGNQPSLLSYYEMTVFFHEIGHALHGLMSDVTYPGLSGLNVARDFVELPSQVIENWAKDPIVMKEYALHYETGEPMPDELMNKIIESSHFNSGFVTVELISSALLDMEYHTISQAYSDGMTDRIADIIAGSTIEKYSMMPEIAFRHAAQHFQHLFLWEYSAGYYSYLWAGVLDADVYEAFKETGDLFDKKTAQSFRDNILSRGNTADPMELYVNFRGREPKVEPLLRQRGLIQ